MSHKINDNEIWRTALQDYRHKVGMTYREIAAKADLTEKAVSRIFTGEAKHAGIDDVRRIITALNAPWREIFGESTAVITTEDIEALKAETAQIREENTKLIAENLYLNDKIKELEANNTLLSIKLEYEQKITALHAYYTKLKEE